MTSETTSQRCTANGQSPTQPIMPRAKRFKTLRNLKDIEKAERNELAVSQSIIQVLMPSESSVLVRT